jgi:hypothetical protein
LPSYSTTEPSKGIATIGGQTFARSLRYGLQNSGGEGVLLGSTFLLERSANTFEAQVGFDDGSGSDPDTPVKIQVIADERRVLEQVVRMPRRTRVTCNVTGAKTVTLTMQQLRGGYSIVAWGDALVVNRSMPNSPNTGLPCSVTDG